MDPERGSAALPMTCRRFIDLLEAYVAAELSPRQRVACAWHAAACRSCACYRRGYLQTIALVRAAHEP